MKRDCPVLATLLLTTLPAAPLLAEHATPEEIKVLGIQSSTSLIIDIESADRPVVDSEFNQEEKPPGYDLVNLSGSYQITPQITLSSGVENLFDNCYQDHLAGYNRNADSDIAVGERLAGPGRNIYLAATLHW